MIYHLYNKYMNKILSISLHVRMLTKKHGDFEDYNEIILEREQGMTAFSVGSIYDCKI